MKVVIVGGGFAGRNLAKALAGKKGMDVVLVDKNNYHFFPPLLYQVATAFIEASNITYPFRKMFQGRQNIRFHNGALLKVNTAEKTIETDTGILGYDYLVLAMGAETNYFGMANVQQNSLPMKTIDDALNLRNHLLLNLERATRATDELERRKEMTLVIAGGGPTGVEVAGMVAEMGSKLLSKDYPELANDKGDIYLVASSESLLSPMSIKAQKEAYKTLSKFGVQIKLQTAVKDYVDGKVMLGNGEQIAASTLIWASGVVASDVPGLPAGSTGRGRRIVVDEHNLLKGSVSIFAIGDICYQATDKNYPNGHPQLAQVAIQQGRHLAKNLRLLVAGKKMAPFAYFNKGSMAIIAKYKAVVDLPVGFFKGFLAWLAWLFIHIIPIAGFRNKAKLCASWFWSFITNDPALRLIIRPGKEQPK